MVDRGARRDSLDEAEGKVTQGLTSIRWQCRLFDNPALPALSPEALPPTWF